MSHHSSGGPSAEELTEMEQNSVEMRRSELLRKVQGQPAVPVNPAPEGRPCVHRPCAVCNLRQRAFAEAEALVAYFGVTDKVAGCAPRPQPDTRTAQTTTCRDSSNETIMKKPTSDDSSPNKLHKSNVNDRLVDDVNIDDVTKNKSSTLNDPLPALTTASVSGNHSMEDPIDQPNYIKETNSQDSDIGGTEIDKAISTILASAARIATTFDMKRSSTRVMRENQSRDSLLGIPSMEAIEALLAETNVRLGIEQLTSSSKCPLTSVKQGGTDESNVVRASGAHQSQATEDSSARLVVGHERSRDEEEEEEELARHSSLLLDEGQLFVNLSSLGLHSNLLHTV